MLYKRRKYFWVYLFLKFIATFGTNTLLAIYNRGITKHFGFVFKFFNGKPHSATLRALSFHFSS